MTSCVALELEEPRPVSSLMNDPLWRAFRDQNSSEARDRLLDRYMPLVTRAAHYIRRRTSDAIELDELISAGSVGLLQAMDRFELHRGLAFSSYAVPRIQGAMIDQLRENDWAPRSVRRRERKVATYAKQGADRRNGTDDHRRVRPGDVLPLPGRPGLLLGTEAHSDQLSRGLGR